MTPIGPELRFFVSREDGEMDLLWSMIYRDGQGGMLNGDAELQRREFEVREWTEDASDRASVQGLTDVSEADRNKRM